MPTAIVIGHMDIPPYCRWTA